MRLLIVEDDIELGRLVQRGLSEAGHAVDHVPDGSRVLARCSTTRYDAILLDIALPGESGMTLCRRLRERGVRAAIIMLTARDGVEDVVAGLRSGADDYVTKPFSFVELEARLDAVMRRCAPGRPTKLTIGDLELDPETHTASRDGEPVDLTRTEFALLETLMHEPGRVFSRSELLERAWDRGSEPRSNVVDVYVRYLRRKIDEPFGRTSIETVHGIGYRFRRTGT
jgi:two-component system OmpR family response regulator